jgi:hypothetical protein
MQRRPAITVGAALVAGADLRGRFSTAQAVHIGGVVAWKPHVLETLLRNIREAIKGTRVYQRETAAAK